MPKEFCDADNISINERGNFIARTVVIADSLENDERELGVLAENFLSEISYNELYYRKDRGFLNLVRKLLPRASDETFLTYISPCLDDLRRAFIHPLECDILQDIVTDSYRRHLKYLSLSPANKSSRFYEIVAKIANFAVNNFRHFISLGSSNHVMRTILNVLSEDSYNNVGLDIEPPELLHTLDKFVEVAVNLPDFHDLCYNNLASGLLQSLLFSVKKSKSQSKLLIKNILEGCKDKIPDIDDKENEPMLRLVEASLQVAGKHQFRKIFKIFFKNNLKQFATSKTCNFAVQKLLRSCKEKEQFQLILNELQEVGNLILCCGNTGIFLELAQCCLRLHCNQGEFVKMMLNIFHCKKTRNEDSEIAPVICCMVTSENYDPENMTVSLHGSLIVQAMLQFSKPIKIVNSLLNMEQKHLLYLFSDQKGCHICDAFNESPYVGEKSRERLFKKLMGSYIQLASSKYGSRSLDSIWKVSSIKNKIFLMDELKQNQLKLTSNVNGKWFANKVVHLDYFIRNREGWIQQQTIETNSRKYFADVIPVKKKK